MKILNFFVIRKSRFEFIFFVHITLDRRIGIDRKSTQNDMMTSFTVFIAIFSILLYCYLFIAILLYTYYTHFSGLCIIDFEQVNTGWIMKKHTYRYRRKVSES